MALTCHAVDSLARRLQSRFVVIGLLLGGGAKARASWQGRPGLHCNDKLPHRTAFALTNRVRVITSDPVKTELIQMRVEADDKELFREAAERAGMTLSEWMADRCRWAARRELGNTPTKDPNP